MLLKSPGVQIVEWSESEGEKKKEGKTPPLSVFPVQIF